MENCAICYRKLGSVSYFVDGLIICPICYNEKYSNEHQGEIKSLQSQLIEAQEQIEELKKEKNDLCNLLSKIEEELDAMKYYAKHGSP